MSANETVTSDFIRPCLTCGVTVHVVNGRAEPHNCDPPTNGAELVARAWWNGWDAKASEGIVEGSTVRPVVVSGAFSGDDVTVDNLLAEQLDVNADLQAENDRLRRELEATEGDLAVAINEASAARRRADEAEAALHATQGEVDRRRPCGNCQHRPSVHGRGYSGCLRCDYGAFIEPATAVD